MNQAVTQPKARPGFQSRKARKGDQFLFLLPALRPHSSLALTAFLGCAILCASCKREKRSFQIPVPLTTAAETHSVSHLAPGPGGTPAPVPNPYEENAYAMSQGQQLYTAYNCVGCHAHGGGGMGPALMDAKWIYGSNPAQIHATILEGRPNGMPAFRGKIPDFQVWQIVAYVRSLSGQVPPTAAAGRDDHMKSAPPPNSAPNETPKITTVPRPG